MNFIEQRLLKGQITNMANIKSKEGFILVHLSHEYTSDSIEHNGKDEESALSPTGSGCKNLGSVDAVPVIKFAIELLL